MHEVDAITISTAFRVRWPSQAQSQTRTHRQPGPPLDRRRNAEYTQCARYRVANCKMHFLLTYVLVIDAPFWTIWLQAPGEAEAELAYLNRIGVIDCVLTDDVDALLFGAQRIMRKYVIFGSTIQFGSH